MARHVQGVQGALCLKGEPASSTAIVGRLSDQHGDPAQHQLQHQGLVEHEGRSGQGIRPQRLVPLRQQKQGHAELTASLRQSRPGAGKQHLLRQQKASPLLQPVRHPHAPAGKIRFRPGSIRGPQQQARFLFPIRFHARSASPRRDEPSPQELSRRMRTRSATM